MPCAVEPLVMSPLARIARMLAPAASLCLAGLVWTPAWAQTTGSVAFDGTDYYTTTVEAVITLTDADLNTATNSRDTAQVTVTSTSDAVGITLTLEETGVNTGVFSTAAPRLNLGFSTTASDNVNEKILVADGATVTVTYADAGPAGNRTDTATWHSGYTGVLSLDKSKYVGLSDVAVISLTDQDLNVSKSVRETIQVTVRSNSDAVGITLTLKETGVDTGLFTSAAQGTNLGFSLTVSDDTAEKILVDNLDTVTVSYADATPAGTRQASALWDDPTTGFHVLDFAAAREADGVGLRWRVTPDPLLVGFHLYRSDRPDAGFVRLTSEMILAFGETWRGTQDYSYLDGGLDPTAIAYYVLESLGLDGSTVVSGPVQPAPLDLSASAQGPSPTPPRPSEPMFVQAPKPEPAPTSTDPAPWAAGLQAGLAADWTLKIGVRGEGLVRVTARQCAEAGFKTAGDPRRLELYVAGQKVAMSVPGEEDGRFDPDDAVTFYAEPYEDRHTDRNVYWLAWTHEPGLRMARADARPQPGEPQGPRDFLEIQRAEENRVYFSVLDAEEDADPWMWALAASTRGVPGGRSFPLDAPAPAAGGSWAVLRYSLAGASGFAGSSPDHHSRVFLNGVLVDDARWDGFGLLEREALVPATALADGTNTVTVLAVGDTGYAFDFVYADRFSLLYRRRLETSGEALAFQVESPGRVRVLGPAGWDPVFLDVTDARAPRFLDGVELEAASIGVGSSWAFSAQALPQGRGRVYAAARGKILEPELRLNTPSFLQNPSTRADAIVVAPRSLLPAARALAAHRASTGLQVVVADAEDVYDEFGHGRPGDRPLRDFLRHAWKSWTRPGPAYVTFLGDGSFDPRNYLGLSHDAALPVHDIPTRHGWVASDLWFARLDGEDLAPDLHLGRIPAATPAEAWAYVEKLKAYESLPPGGPWRRRVLLVADNAEGGLFHAQSEALVPAIRKFARPEPLYLGPTALPELRAALFQGFQGGACFINYAGHGNMLQWSRARILSTDDEAALLDSLPLPVVVAASCQNAAFQSPYLRSLGERYVLAPRRGAVGFWSASGAVPASGNALLNLAFYSGLADGDARTLGQAVDHALASVAADPVAAVLYRDLLESMVLMGDPALRLGSGLPPALAGARLRN